MIRWDEVKTRLDAALKRGGGIVLSTHVNPDGDGLGSELGLYHFLKERGHRVHVINDGAVPVKYRFMPGAGEITSYDSARSRELILGAEIFFVLDNSSPQRLGRLLPDVKESKAFRICVDHHAGLEPFWDLNCVDEEASASGQLVYEAIKALGGRLTPDIAEAIYVSFVTDTGHFRFSKTTATVHRIVAELLDTGGVTPPRIYRALFEGVSPGLNRIVAYALADAHYEYGGRFAWARLTKRQLEECHGFEEDTGDLVNMLLAVDGVIASALIKELADGRTKVSLRSLDGVNINQLAVKLGGGGHVNASGALMDLPLEEAVRHVVDGMKEVLGTS